MSSSIQNSPGCSFLAVIYSPFQALREGLVGGSTLGDWAEEHSGRGRHRRWTQIRVHQMWGGGEKPVEINEEVRE